MTEAGFSKSSDGAYSGAGGRPSFELASTEALDFPREGAILVDELHTAGFTLQQRVVPSAQAQDAQLRATFPAMFTSNTDIASALRGLTSSQIPSPNNRWQGGNRGGWSSAEYDRFLNTFEQTLDHGERVNLLHQAIQIYTEELPAISLFFSAQPFAYVAQLSGPANAAPESNLAWNIQDWEWR
jgi:ABC-type transport system substrate-binding protein